MSQLNQLDLEFISEIKEQLKQRFPNTYADIFDYSSFISRFLQNPNYFHHYEAQYWVDFMIREYISRF